MRSAAMLAVLSGGLAFALAACERSAPRGAEAAAQNADRPRPAITAATPQPAPKPDAQGFVTQAGGSDAFEIAAAKLAQAHALSPAVRAFADMMVHDHTESAKQLQKAVGEAGRALSPAANPAAEQQAELDRLARLTPDRFDKAYVQGQVAAHEKALALLQSYAQDGDEPALQAFATQATATVQQHLDAARGLDRRLP